MTNSIAEHSSIELTSERRQDMLVGALEGGSNHWYRFGDRACNIIGFIAPSDKKTPFVDRLWRTLQLGFAIPIHDVEGPEHLGYISLKHMKAGEQLMLQKQPEHFADIIAENDDASTADVWFQYCVLKELVYG
jgi:hypothetical protein